MNGRRFRFRRRGVRRLIKPVHMCTQLPMLVPQFPVGFREAFEPFLLAPHYQERDAGRQNGRTGQQPMKGQQPWYVIERLATVSTA